MGREHPLSGVCRGKVTVGGVKLGVSCGVPLPMPMLLELGRHGAGIAGCTALGGRRFDGTFATVNQSGWIGGW